MRFLDASACPGGDGDPGLLQDLLPPWLLLLTGDKTREAGTNPGPPVPHQHPLQQPQIQRQGGQVLSQHQHLLGREGGGEMLHTPISEGCTCPVAISPLFSALDGATWPLMEHGGFLESGSTDMEKEKPGDGDFPQRLQVLGSASRASWIFRPGLTRNFGGSRKPGAAGRTAEGWGIGDGKKGFFGRMDLQGSCQATGAALLPPAPLLPPEQAWGECVLLSLCPCVPASPCPCALASTALPGRATLLSLLGKGLL